MSRCKKKGYKKYSKEPRNIRPQRVGETFEINYISNLGKTDTGYLMSIRPGTTKCVKLWIKNNGTFMHENIGTKYYEVKELPYPLLKHYTMIHRIQYIER